MLIDREIRIDAECREHTKNVTSTIIITYARCIGLVTVLPTVVLML
jgi:hypothetical protein